MLRKTRVSKTQQKQKESNHKNRAKTSEIETKKICIYKESMKQKTGSLKK
jgi:hypothetical protein